MRAIAVEQNPAIMFHMEHSANNAAGKPPTGRSRLGRGIDALLERNDSASNDRPAAAGPDAIGLVQAKSPHLLNLSVDLIATNPYQPRRVFSDESLVQLSESLLANGVIQPVIVAKVDDVYQLVAGERRLRAARLAGLKEIPVVVREIDQASQARLALAENIHREDLNPIDRAESYQALMKNGALTQAELATKLGEQRSTIANHLRLLDLSVEVRQLVRNNRLSLGHAKVIAGLPADVQTAIGEKCVGGQWSVRQLENSLAKARTATTRPASAHVHDMAKQITHALGVRAEIQPGSKKGAGRIVLNYSTLNEFDALMARMSVVLSVD